MKIKLSLISLILLFVFVPINTLANGDAIIFLAAENVTGMWDPSMHTIDAQEKVGKFICDPLVAVDRDNNLVPALATSWKSIDDYTIELKLREGVKFHNGKVMTANDVKATMEYISRSDAATGSYYPEPLVCEVIDDYTVRIGTRNTKAASLLHTFPAVSDIVPTEFVENPALWRDQWIGTGPWVFQKYENEVMYFKANPDYWAGAPKVSEFIWKYVGDPDSRLAALLTGEAHIIDRVETEQVPLIEASADAEVYRILMNEIIWMHFRNNQQPFKDNAALRKAFAYGIDREGILEHILQGGGAIPGGFFSVKQFGYLGESPYNFTYDPERAKELLVEAGYPNGAGLPEFEWIIPVGNYPKTVEYGEYITQTLGEIGINVKLTPTETAAWNDMLYNHDAGNIILCGWNMSAPEPDTTLQMLFHSVGLMNAINEKEIDEVLETESNIVDINEREKYLHEEVNRVLLDRMPSVPLVNSEMITGVSKKLKGWELTYAKLSLHEAYLED